MYCVLSRFHRRRRDEFNNNTQLFNFLYCYPFFHAKEYLTPRSQYLNFDTIFLSFCLSTAVAQVDIAEVGLQEIGQSYIQ